ILSQPNACTIAHARSEVVPDTAPYMDPGHHRNIHTGLYSHLVHVRNPLSACSQRHAFVACPAEAECQPPLQRLNFPTLPTGFGSGGVKERNPQRDRPHTVHDADIQAVSSRPTRTE